MAEAVTSAAVTSAPPSAEGSAGGPPAGPENGSGIGVAASARAETEVSQEALRVASNAEDALRGIASSQGQAGEEAAASSNNTPETPVSSKTVPAVVEGDARFAQIRGELAKNGNNNPSDLDSRALDMYYGELADTQLKEGVAEDVANDPLYKEALADAFTSAQSGEGALDKDSITREALKDYNYKKDLEGEKPETAGQEAEQGEQGETQAQMRELTDLVRQQAESISKLNETISQLAAVAENTQLLLATFIAQQMEKNPKKKEALWMQILKLLPAAIALQIAETAGLKV